MAQLSFCAELRFKRLVQESFATELQKPTGQQLPQLLALASKLLEWPQEEVEALPTEQLPVEKQPLLLLCLEKFPEQISLVCEELLAPPTRVLQEYWEHVAEGERQAGSHELLSHTFE